MPLLVIAFHFTRRLLRPISAIVRFGSLPTGMSNYLWAFTSFPLPSLLNSQFLFVIYFLRLSRLLSVVYSVRLWPRYWLKCYWAHVVRLDHVAACWVELAKRTQRCATWLPNACNMSQQCCTNMLHPFGQGFTTYSAQGRLYNRDMRSIFLALTHLVRGPPRGSPREEGSAPATTSPASPFWCRRERSLR